MSEYAMTRQKFLAAAGAAALAAPAVGRAAAARQAERPGRRPNVLLILTDDQGYGDVHSHGNDVLDTPHMDALAAAGARFDRFFVSPVCAPTRASLLTGRYHPRTGCFGVARGEETMRSEEVTLAEILQAAGYATACFGKWHNGAHYPHHPNGQGFDEYLGICCGHWNNYFDTEMEHNGEPAATKGYVNDVLTDAALAFLDRHRERPWLAYLAYNTPHSPFQVPDRYFDKYKARGLDDRLAAIYGMVESLDDCLGRLLARLDALRLADDTIVVFLTDNGPNGARANGRMRGQKGSVHEGGVRVPCFLRWPGRIRPGTVVKPIAAHMDLLPTLVELTGVPMPRTEPLDGVSLVPLLLGKAAGWPDRPLFTFFGEHGAVRTSQYRLTVEGARIGLYDMLADPEQQRDIAREKPDVVRDLKAAFDAKRAEVNQGLAGRLPIPVGHEQRKLVEMPAVEGTWSGGLQLGGRHPNNNWLTAWTRLDAAVTWDLEVVHAGPYEASLRYICPKEQVGSRLRLEAGGEAVEAALDQPCEPNFVPSPDRVPREEVYERRWGLLPLGTLRLPKGRVRLTLRAVPRPGQAAMDLKSLRLRRTD